MKERQLFIALTFLPVALAVFFWDLDAKFSAVTLQQEFSSEADNQLPTTILENTRLTQFDLSGTQSQRITSTKLLSHDLEEGVDIQNPVITLETTDGKWVAESLTGEFNQLENRLSLRGSVVLTQSKGQKPVQMRTEQLDYYPEIRLAESASQVVIVAQGHQIESLGIRVDLAHSIYTLPARVRSRHEPM